jgi:hypothetical protein
MSSFWHARADRQQREAQDTDAMNLILFRCFATWLPEPLLVSRLVCESKCGGLTMFIRRPRAVNRGWQVALLTGACDLGRGLAPNGLVEVPNDPSCVDPGTETYYRDAGHMSVDAWRATPLSQLLQSERDSQFQLRSAIASGTQCELAAVLQLSTMAPE